MKPISRSLPGLVASMTLVALPACGGDNPAPATEILDWNAFTTELVAQQAPPLQTHTLAIVQLAVHDALNASNPDTPVTAQ